LQSGIAAPKNTPAEIVAKLNKEINASLIEPAMKARFIALGGYTAFASSPAEFSKLIGEYTEKWGKVIRAANISRLRWFAWPTFQIHWPLFELPLCCSCSSLHLLTAGFGTRPLCRDVRDQGEYWRVSGLAPKVQPFAAP
jgi:hypothetical protein